MIFDKVISILFGLLGALLGLLPAWSFDTGFSDAASALTQGVQIANAFFPVQTLGICLAAVLGLRAAMGGWQVAVWLYDKIPFKAS